MNIVIESNMDELEGSIFETFGDSNMIAIQDAMAIRCSDIVLNNFGFDGEDRPEPWPALSEKYAREFHDGNRIPKLILTGDLRSSIDVQLGSRESASCFTNNEYATEHQEGTEFVPARPFFPITADGELTEYTKGEVIAAAMREIDYMLTR